MVDIDEELVPVASPDVEYLQILAKMDAAFPPVSRVGFDFEKIRGNIKGRTAEAIILALALHGWSVAQIADTLDVSPYHVGRLLAKAIREASPICDVEVLRDFELQKLNEQERVCWEQYKRSCEDEVSAHEVIDKEGEVRELSARKVQSGNPTYQRILTDIGKRRASLLGLDAPSKVQVDKREQKLQITEVIVRTHEEVKAAMAAGLLPAPGE